jgi:hypothetical protein
MAFVIRFDKLNIEDVVFTDPKINPKTKALNAAILNKQTKKGFGIETPNMKAPFGVSAYDPSDGADETKITYSLPLSVEFKPTEEATDEESVDIKGQRQLIEFLKGMDALMIDYGIKHSQMIFKKTYANTPANRGIVEALYTKAIKDNVGKDGTQYPDRINIKLMRNQAGTGPDDKILFFKESSTPLVIENWKSLSETIPKGSTVKAIIQPQIFFVAGKFGLKVKLIQMKLPNVQRVGRPITYAFSEPPAEEVATVVKKSSDTHADDSDAEPDTVEETEEENAEA